LEEAIAARVDDEQDIPSPSAAKRGERLVSVPPSMALKAAYILRCAKLALLIQSLRGVCAWTKRRSGAFSTRITQPSFLALKRRCPLCPQAQALPCNCLNIQSTAEG
jgi:hypothetical protein